MMRYLSPLLVCFLLCTGYNTGFAQGMNATDPTKNAGNVEWRARRIDLGEVAFEVPVVREYVVKNISKEPLTLLTVKSGCHCTTVNWNQNPVAPGDSTTIKATFDASKEGPFYKIITVTTSFDPENPVALTLVGTVLPKPAKN